MGSGPLLLRTYTCMYTYTGRECGAMAVSVNARKRGLANQRRWNRDQRAPALRLPTPAPARPDPTVQLPVVPPRTAPVVNDASRKEREGSLGMSFQKPVQPVIELREVQQRQTMPFMGRVTACPYLECRSSNRRCLSSDPAPISLERQVRHCFSEHHRQCRYYRKARGLPRVPPNQAAFYTAAAVLLLVIVALASL